MSHDPFMGRVYGGLVVLTAPLLIVVLGPFWLIGWAFEKITGRSAL